MNLIGRIGAIAATFCDPGALLAALGPWLSAGVALIVFIESGVLFPFLPGDSLLVTAAVVHGALGAALWRVVVICLLAAVAGDQVGYWLGSRYGRRLFRDDARVLRADRLEAAEAFFARYGRAALVLGRFAPIVRTYVPFAAGAARMGHRRFTTWNVLGALAWVGAMTGVGLLLAGVPGIADSIEGVMIVVIAVSLLPVLIPALLRWRRRRHRGRSAEDGLAAVPEGDGADSHDAVGPVPGNGEGADVLGDGGLALAPRDRPAAPLHPVPDALGLLQGQAQAAAQQHRRRLAALGQVPAQPEPPGRQARTAQHQGGGQHALGAAAVDELGGEDPLRHEGVRPADVQPRPPDDRVVGDGVYRHLRAADGA